MTKSGRRKKNLQQFKIINQESDNTSKKSIAFQQSKKGS